MRSGCCVDTRAPDLRGAEGKTKGFKRGLVVSDEK